MFEKKEVDVDVKETKANCNTCSFVVVNHSKSDMEHGCYHCDEN